MASTKKYSVVVSIDGTPALELSYSCWGVPQVIQRFMASRSNDFCRTVTVAIYYKSQIVSHGKVVDNEWYFCSPPRYQQSIQSSLKLAGY